MNRKGDVFQLLFVLIIVFIATVVGLLFWGLTSKVLDAYQNTPAMQASPIAAQTNALLQETGPKTTDYMIFFLFLFSNVGILLSASRTRFSPTVIFLFIILTLITIFVAAGFVNIYQGFAQADALSSAASQLSLTNFVFSKYTPLFMSVMSGLIMFLMWSRSGGEIIA